MNDLMFQVKGKRVSTLNPVTGCRHSCKYCYARELIEGRLKNTEKYRCHGFEPTYHSTVINYPIKGKNTTYFVCSLGDLFGEWVSPDWIHAVMMWCSQANFSNTFFFLTKSPRRYKIYEPWVLSHPNFFFGTTIETDLMPYRMSNAPPPLRRYEAMRELKINNKFVSIEPIMAFSDNFIEWIREIRPAFVYIGYDNHNHNLPEPLPHRTQWLIEEMQKFTEVRIKTLRGK